MSNNIKTVNMDENTLNNVFEDLNFLSKLMDDMVPITVCLINCFIVVRTGFEPV